MLIMTNNLDRTDEGAISNWPFTYGSSLDTGDGVLSADSFLSVSINVDSSVALPCRFKGVSMDGRLIICDASGREICSGRVFARTRQLPNQDPDEISSFFLYDQYGILKGFICCKTDVCLRLYSIAEHAGDMHYFDDGAFVLLPQCHIQSMHGVAKSFGVSGSYTTADTNIRCSALEGSTVHVSGATFADARRCWNVTPEKHASAHSFSVFNVEALSDNTWCRVVVGGGTYNVSGKNLLIKSGITSNLRVTMTDASIILKGVLDA